MSLGDGLTWADWARLVAGECGVHGLSDVAVEILLLEYTAWPISCDPAYLRPQLIAALVGPAACPCCGGPMAVRNDETWGVCAMCVARHNWA